MTDSGNINPGIPFEPTARQQQFMMAVEHADEIGYGGALGGGKTYSLCWFAHYMSTAYPGNRGAIFRENLVDLRKTTYHEFKKFMNRHYPNQPITWRTTPQWECDIDCGGGATSTILWLETKNPDNHQSLNIAWAALDEASQVSLDAYLVVSGRTGRHDLADGTHAKKILVWGSNPGPGWCKDKFPVGGEPKKKTVVLDNGSKYVMAFVPALPSDNPHLHEDYIPGLRAKYPKSWIDRLLKGDWDAFEGQVFVEFNEAKHVLRYHPDRGKLQLSGWMHIMGADWGYKSAAACVCCTVDYDGDWWVWDEYYANERSVSVVAGYWRDLAADMPWRAMLLDYAAVDQSTGTSIIHMFNELGLDFWPCSKRKHGADGSIMFLKALFENDRIHISPRCVNLIRELKNARWETVSAGQADKKSAPDKMMDINDHAIDALFYAFEYWRQRPDVPVPQAVTRETAAAMVRQQAEDDKGNKEKLASIIRAHDELGGNLLTGGPYDDRYFDSYGEAGY